MRKTTIILITLTAAVLIVYDIFALMWGEDATISQVIRDWGRAMPFVAVFGGVLMGHFFINWKNPWQRASRYITLAILFVASSIIFQIIKLPSWAPFACGLFLGSVFWTLPPRNK